MHQKIDRVAHRHISKLVPLKPAFPSIHDVLHFEGSNGPDGIKRKSPGKDEPWHYIDPTNPEDIAILQMINDHIFNMSAALKAGNQERAAFEAAWMSHAIVDGLTPAHHYPLDEKIEELWGKPREERLTIRDKNLIRGTSRRDTLSKNWQYWGARGVFTSHFMFEWGVATSIAPLKFDDTVPSKEELTRATNVEFDVIFLETLHRIADMEMYKEFCKSGWTRQLAQQTRATLIPEIIKAVILAWYRAVSKAK